MTEEKDRTWRVTLPVVTAVVVMSVAWPTAHVELGLGAATAMVAGLAAAAPIALAGVAPAPAWSLSALGAALVAALGGPGATGLAVPVAHLVALLGLLLVVGVRCAPWLVAVAGVVTAAVPAVRAAPTSLLAVLVLVVAMVLVVAVLARQLLGSRRALARSEEVGEQERERRLVVEERARIARDLHDVVAHSMSLVVVRAQSARYRVPGTSAEMGAELTAIADVARAALGELRGVLGVLRSEGTAPGRPQPGPADVDDLLEATRDAGVDLTVTRDGDLVGAGAGVILSLYRILAEALANAGRHASGAPVAVVLHRDEAAVRLRVTNPPGRDVTGPGSGLGLTSMRERAAAVGGELTVRDSVEGFGVEAVLPVSGAGVGVAA